jgi:hypothetical protein
MLEQVRWRGFFTTADMDRGKNSGSSSPGRAPLRWAPARI